MHGLSTIVFLNSLASNAVEAARHQSARDPGHKAQRQAELDLEAALARLAEPVPEPGTFRATPFPPPFSIASHYDTHTYYVLPLTGQGRGIAQKLIPAGTRRFGMHYVLEGEEGAAILASITAALEE